MKTLINVALISMVLAIQAGANPGQLSAAVSGNDFERVQRLLDNGANLNEEDAFGRRPIFFASDPEMAQLLFSRGALIATYRGAAEIHTDSMGKNPLHFLLGHTAPYLLKHAKNEQAVMNQIEQTAYVFLRAYCQEVGAGFLRTRVRLEHQVDGNNNLPSTYLFDRPWNPNFAELISRDHIRNYRWLKQAMETPNIESPIDRVFGRSYYFVGPGSF